MAQVDFPQIRAVRGSANNGFEELCCQLAGTESVPVGANFVRNGTPDGGVEAYWVLPNGTEYGWQAKYFFQLEETQWRQIDKSVNVALAKHPRLTKYTVCLPIDLPDARVKGRKSLRGKWETRVAAWCKAATCRGMSVTFDLWGEHQLTTRLAEERHAGRRWYFFHNVEFSQHWFQDHIAEAFAAAGPRYTPELNVDLPIAIRFESLGYNAGFRRRISEARGKFREQFASLRLRLQLDGPDEAAAAASEAVRQSGDALLLCLDEFGEAPRPTH